MPDIEEERIRNLNGLGERPGGRYVAYWMQQAQRTRVNDALDVAVRHANRLRQGVCVVFGLDEGYPEANLRHFAFLVDGLRDVEAALAARRIPFVVLREPPPDAALRLAEDASLVVCDRGYLRHQRAWRRRVAARARCRVVEVEADAVVPVETVSGKAEYAARTIRPRVLRHLDRFLVRRRAPALRRPLPAAPTLPGAPRVELGTVLGRLRVDRSVGPVGAWFRGGQEEARRRLRRFLAGGLSRYAAHRNRPETDDVSGMAMYLHFGHLSPVEFACRVREAGGPAAPREALLEELCVRRELANNFAHYHADYDRYAALPDWARGTLGRHAADPRPHRYGPARLDAGDTHDRYWNAAMEEMRETGYMHNYMRMYWGKKILEWSDSPEEAFATALEMNNRYFLDGRDPSSYAGVGWVFGLHDRPWARRPVFGTVRYMAASGLERKCDIEGYVRKVARRCGHAPPP